jgi:uncharacterized protein with NAD-binding domain and iron-sulfur cluster
MRPEPAARRRITLIGGGIASLFLALDLEARLPDADLTFITADREPQLGGHLASWEQDGLPIEHGFHTLFGFYDAVFPYLKQAGILHHFVAAPRRVHLLENGALHTLHAASWFRFSGHSLRQKFNLLSAVPGLTRLLIAARSGGVESIAHLDHLDLRELGSALGMSPALLDTGLVRMFYEFGFNGPAPLSAAVGLMTLAKLLDSPSLYHFRRPSREALIQPLYDRMLQRGRARVHFGRRLLRVHGSNDGRRVTAVEVTRAGSDEIERIDVDELVLGLDLEGFKAVSFEGPLSDMPFVKDARRLETVSSISLQAFFPEDPVPAHIDNVIGGLPPPLGVLCPISRVRGDPPGPSGHEIIGVGPEGGFEHVPDTVIVEQLFQLLRRVGFRIPAGLRGVRVHVGRNRAPGQRYLLTRPGTLALRPTPVTPVENLHLVGAWLRTAFPLPSVQAAALSSRAVAATLESRLGRAAAPLRVSTPAPVAPLCPPPPYHHESVRASFFLVNALPEPIRAALPALLEPAPGFESRALITAMHYGRVYAPQDPTGAEHSFHEVVVAAVVRSVRPGLPVGLYPLVLYMDSDVGVAVGREYYGFPKKLAEIRRDPGALLLRRPGRRPGEGPGLVHPMDLLRISYRAEERSAPRAVLGEMGTHAAQGLAVLVNQLDGLPFYLHQHIPAAPGAAEGRVLLSRILRVPLTRVRVNSAAAIRDARIYGGDSTLDNLASLAPDPSGELPVVAAFELDMGFIVDRAEVIAESSQG